MLEIVILAHIDMESEKNERQKNHNNRKRTHNNIQRISLGHSVEFDDGKEPP